MHLDVPTAHHNVQSIFVNRKKRKEKRRSPKHFWRKKEDEKDLLIEKEVGALLTV